MTCAGAESIDLLLYEEYFRDFPPPVDILGPYFDSFCDACRSAFPGLDGESLWQSAVSWASDLLAEAEARRDLRGEIRALYLQQRMELHESLHGRFLPGGKG